MKFKPGDVVRTRQVKHSEQLALIIQAMGHAILVSRIPRLSQTELVSRSCIEEVVLNPELSLPIEELLTHEQEWVRKAAKIRFETQDRNS
jgi:hypothetical protein